MKPVGVGIIGCGGITLQNHLPGLALCPQAKLAALCDSNPGALKEAGRKCGLETCFLDYAELLRRGDVDAVIIATPNVFHAPIALAAVAAGKHVFVEKPLAMNLEESRRMLEAAERAGLRHMAAFTYRFVPAMRYMAHLVQQGAIGQPYHFRSCRLQDWDERGLGWRQVSKLAGSGELGDMLSHRIDYAHSMLGPMRRTVSQTRRFHDRRGGQPSDLEDWVAVIAEFQNGATGVLESSKLATGRGEGAHSQDYVELNGSEGTLVFQLEQPHRLGIGKRGEVSLNTVQVPREFLKAPGSPRDPDAGDPLFNFRYDQTWEFLQAIEEQRECRPSFRDGFRAQAVMEAASISDREKRWVEVPT